MQRPVQDRAESSRLWSLCQVRRLRTSGEVPQEPAKELNPRGAPAASARADVVWTLVSAQALLLIPRGYRHLKVLTINFLLMMKLLGELERKVNSWAHCRPRAPDSALQGLTAQHPSCWGQPAQRGVWTSAQKRPPASPCSHTA